MRAPKVSAGLKHTAANGAIANVNASYRREYEDFRDDEIRTPVTGTPRFRDLGGEFRSYDYEFGGDYQFPLIGGSLKLIALDRFQEARYMEEAVTRRTDDTPSTGGRYAQIVDSGEVIGGPNFPEMGKARWQIATEAAFTASTRTPACSISSLRAASSKCRSPKAMAACEEDRYEGSISYGRPLSSKFTIS